MKFVYGIASLILLLGSVLADAQQVVATNTNVVVPPLVNFSGTLSDENGKPLTEIAGVTFYLYQEQQGGAPLWMETQNVQPNPNGQYTVMLGATSSTGLPATLFQAGEAHWLGVQVQGQAEQPRVLLLSVPYALKAGDAQTVGGLPASAFVLATPPSGGTVEAASEGEAPNPAATVSPATSSDVTTSGGTVNAIPLFSTATNIQNSLLTQSGTAAINVGGRLNLPALGTATSSAGFNSRPLDFVASSYDSSTSSALAETFQWQAQPAGNDTSTPSGTLNLLFGSDTTTPTQTGLNIASTGLITFAKGQTFPGTGTITGVTTASGSGLTGGGTSGTLSLSLMTGCSTNQVLQWNGSKWACSSAGAGTITGVTAGTGLSGGGTSGNVTLTNTGLLAVTAGTGISSTGGQSPTLSINTSVIPELSAANTFVGNQTITGNLTASGTLTATGATINSTGLFPFEVNGSNSGSTTIYAHATNTTGPAWGVLGQTDSTNASAVGVFGLANATSGTGAGVVGQSNGPGTGVVGQGASGVVGTSATCCGFGGFFTGYSAPSGSGQFGTEGVKATGGGADPAGNSGGGDGVDAYGGNGDFSATTDIGGNGVSGFGGGGGGVNTGLGSGSDGPGGAFYGGGDTFGGDGVDGYGGSGYAGFFYGNVDTTGQYLTNGSAAMEIDHPLDPANKYLVHASVESSEMMNIYTGNVTTDAQGEATVQLPEWFEVLNTDFRYQLTVIGQFAQAIISRKIENHRFQIRTSAPNVEVSWQVTGVRQDAYAKAHPLVVEKEKEARLRGYYTHPELYGQPEDKQIEWARHPAMMKKMQQLRQAQLQHRAGQTAPAAMPAASLSSSALPRR